MNEYKYRIYADGNIVGEDEFNEYDNTQPYYDDYHECDNYAQLSAYLHEIGEPCHDIE